MLDNRVDLIKLLRKKCTSSVKGEPGSTDCIYNCDSSCKFSVKLEN